VERKEKVKEGDKTPPEYLAAAFKLGLSCYRWMCFVCLMWSLLHVAGYCSTQLQGWPI